MSSNNFRFKEPQGLHSSENPSFVSPQPSYRYPQITRTKDKDTSQAFVSQGSPYSYHLYDNQNVYQNYNVPSQINIHPYVEQFGQITDNYYNVGYTHESQPMMNDQKSIQLSPGQRIDPSFFNVPHFETNQQQYYHENYYTRVPSNQNYAGVSVPFSQMGMISNVQEHQVPRTRGNFHHNRLPRASSSPRYGIQHSDPGNLAKSRNPDDLPASLQQRLQSAIKQSQSSSSPSVSKSTIDQSILTQKTQVNQKFSNPVELNMTNDEFPTLTESTGGTTTVPLSHSKSEVIVNILPKSKVNAMENKVSSSLLSRFPYKMVEITKFFSDFEPYKVSEISEPDDKYLTSELLNVKSKSLTFGRKLCDYITNIDSTDERVVHQLLASPRDNKMAQDHLIDFPVPYEYLIYQSIKDKVLRFDCSKFSDDVLFYVYYVEMGDATQMLAAYNLYLRKWRFYSIDKTWVKIVIPYTAGDSYKYFDPNSWQILSRDTVLDLTRLDDSQFYMPFMNHEARVVLAQSIDDDDQSNNIDRSRNHSIEDNLILNRNKE